MDLRVFWDACKQSIVVPARQILDKTGIRIPRHSGFIRSEFDDFCMAVPFDYKMVPARRLRIAVICHLFYVDQASFLYESISHIKHPANIFISTNTAEKKAAIALLFSGWDQGHLEIRVVPNRGRDIAPKLVTFADVYSTHDVAVFIHSKKSLHFGGGQDWVALLIGSLLGSEQVVDSILQIFETCPEVGFVIPQHFKPIRDKGLIHWAKNFTRAKRLARRMGIDLPNKRAMDLAAGSMFWARSAALRPLLDLNLTLGAFQPEAGQIDGTTAHAIERLFLYGCERAGFTWVKVVNPQFLASDAPIVAISQPSDIRRFVCDHRFDLLPNG